MSPTVGTDSEVGGRRAAPRSVSTTSRTVAAAMAMMKAKRCNGLNHSSSTINPSVTPPMVVAATSIWSIRSSRSSAWATRFEKVLA